MKPFRQHVAIAVDGGGIKGVIVTRALAILEKHLSQSSHGIFRLGGGHFHKGLIEGVRMKRKRLGVVTDGAFNAGLTVRLDPRCSTEDLRIGDFVIVQGE